MLRPLVRASIVHVCLTLAVLASPRWAAGQELLPNLRALPAFDLSVSGDSTGYRELRFSVTSWNSGAGRFEIVPGATGQGQQYVYQRVYTASGGFTDYLAGRFEFHEEHDHIHFQDYALYSLQPVNAPGASNRQSSKTSFCLRDGTKVNTRLPGAPKKPVYTTCTALLQGISVGWGDTYLSYLAGQQIDITGNPDGLYELTIDIDPFGRLRETSDTDNTACSLLQISVTAMTVQELGACGATGANVTVTSIAPSSTWMGTVVDVTILGTNFSEGIAVGFENGSGPAPSASNVTVLDSTTISATVTVKNGGNSRDPVWDLRVGSAVLPDAFEVLR